MRWRSRANPARPGIDACARGLAEYLELCEQEGVDPATAEREELRRLRRDIADLHAERDVLRRVFAYCAREMGLRAATPRPAPWPPGTSAPAVGEGFLLPVPAV